MLPRPMKPLAPQAKSPAFGRLGLLCVALCWMAFPGWGQVSTDEEALPTRILFVFDASNSMNAFWGGDRKIQTATRLLSETLKGLHQSNELELGLRVYGHGTKHVPGKQDCDDTELVVPFSSFNNLIIKQALSRIRAQGTTPIARSLELAAEDFPEAPGRNVIVLITDGIEACDEDPCAVSRALQAKGVTLKPFVIGMGMDDLMAESLNCIGNFYDAADPQAFEHVLQLVLEQAMHNTTVQVDLLNHAGEATESNLAYSFTDSRTGVHHPQWVHTLRWGGGADTLYIDPLPLYTLTVHSLPEARLDSLALKPGVHNTIAVPDMGSGHLTPQFARGVRTDYGKVNVQWHVQGDCDPFFSSDAGEGIPVAHRDVRPDIWHHPPLTVAGVQVKEGQDAKVEIPAPGSLVLQAATSGYAVVMEAQSLRPVLQFDASDLAGMHTLQPGDYTVIFRARNARGTLYSIQKNFTVASGNTTTIKLHG